MITPDYLRRIAIWSRELPEREIEAACAGITERSYRAGEFVFLRGDRFDYWTGVVTGLMRMSIVSRGGKAMTFTGLSAGGALWARNDAETLGSFTRAVVDRRLAQVRSLGRIASPEMIGQQCFDWGGQWWVFGPRGLGPPYS